MSESIIEKISPITFVGNKFVRDQYLNSLFSYPFINQVYNDFYNSNCISQLSDDTSIRYYRNGKIDSITQSIYSYIKMNGSDIIYSFLIKFVSENLGVENMHFLYDFQFNQIINTMCGNVVYKSCMIRNDEVYGRLYTEELICRNLKYYEDDKVAFMGGTLMILFNNIFGAAVELFNLFIEKFVSYKLFSTNPDYSIFKNLYEDCYGEKVPENTDVYTMYTTCTCILREIAENYINGIREGLDKIKETVGNMILLSNSEVFKNDIPVEKYLSSNLLISEAIKNNLSVESEVKKDDVQ